MATGRADRDAFCTATGQATTGGSPNFRPFPAVVIGMDNALNTAMLTSTARGTLLPLASCLTPSAQPIMLSARGKRCYNLIHAAVDAGATALSFLVYRPGLSARSDWSALKSRYPREMARILRHLVAVDSGGVPAVNTELAKATIVPNNPGSDFYWWNVGAIGVFYQRQGAQTVVVDVTTATSAPPYYTARSLRRAKGRL